MLNIQLRIFGSLLLLLALQVLVFGHIHLFGYATPMIYTLFAAHLRRGIGRAESLLWCFAMGLAVDVFTLTPGLSAASMTLLGLIQPVLFERMLPKDAAEDCSPGFRLLGTVQYIEYLFILILVHNFLYFAVEACTFAHWHDSVIRMASSTLLTMAVALPLEKVRE